MCSIICSAHLDTEYSNHRIYAVVCFYFSKEKQLITAFVFFTVADSTIHGNVVFKFLINKRVYHILCIFDCLLHFADSIGTWDRYSEV